MSIEGNPLTAVSNVIELKPGHKYLLLIKGRPADQETFMQFQRAMESYGIRGVSLVYDEGRQEVSVIEVPEGV